MLQFDLSTIDNKRIGRMGRLVVELELIARGWLVGSLTPSTASPVGWDFLAFDKDRKRSIKLRVKAKRPETDCFRWVVDANKTVFSDLADGDESDFVAAVNFHADKSCHGSYEIYIVPTRHVEDELKKNHTAYLAKSGRHGEERKDSDQRNLYLNKQMGAPGHGYVDHWECFKGNWDFDARRDETVKERRQIA